MSRLTSNASNMAARGKPHSPNHWVRRLTLCFGVVCLRQDATRPFTIACIAQQRALRIFRLYLSYYLEQQHSGVLWKLSNGRDTDCTPSPGREACQDRLRRL